MGVIDGPIFADSKGGHRDRNNVLAKLREVRDGTRFEWITSHIYRKTVATILDDEGRSARHIADQLGHARVSMTQDKYIGRRAGDGRNSEILDSLDPDGRADEDDSTAAGMRR